MLIIRRIHVKYLLKAGEEHRAAIDRAYGAHAEKCPVYRSLRDAIDITTELSIEPETSAT